MSEQRQDPTVKRGRFALCALLAIAASLLVVGFQANRFHNDAAQYESTARNIRDLGEISTSCLFYGEHLVSGRMPAPQTVFPPIYPLVMAAVSAGTGMDLRTSGFLINLIGFFATGLLLYELCVYLGGHWLAALLSTLSWLGLAVVLQCTLFGLSESLFMTFVVLSLRLLAVGGTRYALVAGCFAAAAVGVRYAGLLLIITAGLSYAIQVLLKGDRKRIAEGIAFAVPPLITALLLFRRNAHLVDTSLGGNNYGMQDSVGRTVILFVSNLMKLCGIDRFAALSSELAVPLTVAAIVLLVVMASRFLADKQRCLATLKVLTDSPVALLVALFPWVYLGLLFTLHLTKGSGLTDRLMMPALPLLAIGYALLVSRVEQPVGSKWFVRAATGLILVLFVVGQFNAYRTGLRESETSVRLKHVLAETRLDSGESLESFLRERASTEKPLLANQPQLIHGLLGKPVVGLATHRYRTGGEWTPESVANEIIDRFHVGYVLWVKKYNVISEHTPRFYFDLDTILPDRLRCVFRNRDVELYQVRHPEIRTLPSRPHDKPPSSSD